jgi:hypothetical protein
MSAVFIQTITDNSVTVVDTLGRSSVIVIPSLEVAKPHDSVLMKLEKAEDVVTEASSLYRKVDEDEGKQLMLMVMRAPGIGWDVVNSHLDAGELAQEGHEYSDQFMKWVKEQMEV